MERLFTLAAALAMLSIGSSALAQQEKRARNDQPRGIQQDRGARQGGDQGRPGGADQRGDRGGRRGGQGGGQGGRQGGGLFRLLDIDRDGKLSAKEIDGAVAALMKLDVNDDGILDAQELVVRGGGGGRAGQGGRGQGRNDQGRGGQGGQNRDRQDRNPRSRPEVK